MIWPESPPVLYINRAADSARREAFQDACLLRGIAPRRCGAVDREDRAALSAAADMLPETFWEGGEIKPGAFACFLSHRRAWAHAAAGDAPWTLICEDDSPPEAGGDVISAVAGLGARAGADFIFCGPRACALRDALSPEDRGLLSDAGALAAALAGGLPAHGPRAPGADSLLVSRRGARRMLAATGEDRCCAGLDWLLLFRCWDSRPGAAATGEMAALRRMLGAGPARLSAAVAPEPLSFGSGAPSVLLHRRRLPIAALGGAA